MNFKEKLEKGKFVITAELGPPKGTDVSKALDSLKYFSGVDAINVTDNQTSIMRLSSWGLCKLILDKGFEPVLQVTCRDRNRLALQSDLLGAYALGMKNVLALTGDHPSFGDHPEAKPVFDIDSVQLLKIISGLNKGVDSVGNKLEGKTDFFMGAAVNPSTDAKEEQHNKFLKKIEAGAQFFQTQVVYDVDVFKDFFKGTKAKILAGILPLKSAKMARYMNKNVPGVNVPESLIKELEESKNQKETGIEQVAKIISELKKLCAGVHIMTIGNEEVVAKIVETI